MGSFQQNGYFILQIMIISVSELVQNIISEMQGRCVKVFLFFTVMLILTGEVWSQNSAYSNYFLKAVRLNSGFTMWENGPEQFHKFYEITWSNQISVSITHDLYLGIQLYSLYTWGSYVKDENFLLRGIFVQYDLMYFHKAMGFVEVNYNQGDYCYCGPGDPYRYPNLHYIGMGGGIDYPILKSNFFINGSVILHLIAGSAENKYQFIIYKLGLSYRFGKSKYADLP